MQNINLGEFVRLYVDSIINHRNGNRLGQDLDGFYSDVFKDVSERTGISPEDVKFLQHPFHWAMFSDRRGSVKSIIPVEYGESSQRLCSEGIDERTAACDYILEKYRPLLETRLRMKGISVSP